ncbi:MAG: histidinol dehydrogenase [Oscillospiraceae bacterium]|nr:histidinol dehydrogenase [Oscillospiraceae bacterium]
MIPIVRADTAPADALFARQLARRGAHNEAVRHSVEGIVAEVRVGGWEAVRRFSLQFDGQEPYEVSSEQRAEAAARCDPAVRDALRRAAARIRDYQMRLLTHSQEWECPGGGRAGVLVRGMARVGLYVPGGTAAYPSSVLMNAVPATVAGVGELIMVTPPGAFLSPAVLAAADIAGVHRVFAVGGAQAIAALALGASPIPQVDKIVGPGNAFVAEAKRQLYGQVDIDMVAGPSEVLVMADDSAPASYVAADLLSQAEHDELAASVLVTVSEKLAQEVASELARQVALLPRGHIARASLSQYGAVVVCESWRQGARIVNRIAPEHLEIMTENPRGLLPLIQNAGAVFLGLYSPEPLGDYIAGPSHVLPTSGTARFQSPLSCESFLKKTSLIEYGPSHLEPLARDIEALAQNEGLQAHATSVTMRFTP